MQKPILFHDIDGILFGQYDGEFQLRPGVSTWLNWAHQHFEVVWLTSWNAEKIKNLLSVIYCEKLVNQGNGREFRSANWMNYVNKAAWLSAAMPRLQGREWFWIDDDVDDMMSDLKDMKVPIERCIQVNPEGANELITLTAILSDKLQSIASLH